MISVSASAPLAGVEGWTAFVRPRPEARLRLFCLPHIGGGAALYRTWLESTTAVEVCPVELPGRGARLREPAFDRMGPLVEELTRALRPRLDRPFAIFGHSMGALVAFEWARELRRQGAALPGWLFVSGRRAPQLPDPGPRVHQAPDRELIAHLRRLGGTPGDVLEDPDVMRHVMPTLRADFAVCETYVYADEAPLPCAISALGGREDEHARPADLQAWGEQTTGPFRMELFPGGHFFVREQPLREALRGALEGALHRVESNAGRGAE